ncbi:MAG TPA: FAD-dependent monooxygenase [Bryobacteraceae bacterium]|nr:FAD-dependent monooxygenase [Bryobacteraceae bacterium]
MVTDQKNVLIVGAGPTGLTLACRCRQLGLDVRIIDRKPGPARTSNAIGLQYRVSEILQIMGIYDRFAGESCSPTAVNLYSGERQLLQFQFLADGRPGSAGTFEPRALMIPQSRTEELLGNFLSEIGGRVEWNTDLLDYHQREDGVSARLSVEGGKETWSGAWLVSCEGSHSRVRKQAGIAFRGKTYPLHFVLADFRINRGLPGGENHVWLHPDGAVALLPLPGDGLWRCIVELRSRPSGDTWTLLRDALSERVAVAAKFEIDAPEWVSGFDIHCRLVDRYRDGRIFLAGDAAHIHSYTGGQGIATGVQDAFNLAWKLARVAGGAPEALLDTYEEERRLQAEMVLRQTDRVTSLLISTTPWKRRLREWIVLPTLRSAWFQRRFFGKFTQLNVRYRQSLLSQGPRSGERAPDLALPEGTLFEKLRAGKPLILLGANVGSPALLAALMRLNLLPQIRGAGNSLIFVRPDGHFGLVQRSFRPRELKEYLKLVCDPERVEAAFSDTLHNELEPLCHALSPKSNARS